jgi:hypothetical protein
MKNGLAPATASLQHNLKQRNPEQPDEPLVMITVRLPQSLRDQINAHSWRRHVSTNKWCVMALLTQLAVDEDVLSDAN